MEKMSHITLYIFWMGVIQGLFFALILLSIRAGRIRSNRVLAALLISVAAGFISIISYDKNMVESWPRLSRILILLSLYSIPLLYFHVMMLIHHSLVSAVKIVLHALPVALLISFILIFGAPAYDLAEVLKLYPLNHIIIVKGIWILYTLPYLISIYRVLRWHSVSSAYNHDKNEKLNYYCHERAVLCRWARNLLVTCSLYWVFSLVTFFYRDFTGYYLVISLVTTTMIYVAGFLAINKPGVFYIAKYGYGESENTRHCVTMGDETNE